MKADTDGYVKGTFWLVVTSFIVKILSAIYRVPFQNLVGDEGFYIYQQVYPLYGLVMTFSLVSLPAFLSKLMAEYPEPKVQHKLVEHYFALLLAMSLILSSLLWFSSGLIAQWMGDIHLSGMIRVVALSIIILPSSGIYRGYFQGNLYFTPTAISQLLEQGFRVSIILYVAWYFSKNDGSLYLMGTWTMAAALIGGIVSFLFLYSIYQRRKINSMTPLPQTLTKRKLLRRLGEEGSLFFMYSALLLWFQLADSFIVKNQLVAQGFSSLSAKFDKGAFDRGQPFIQMGLVLILTLLTTFLPLLKSFRSHQGVHNFSVLSHTFQKTIWIVASVLTIGLISILDSLNIALFSNNHQGQALKWLMFSIFLFSLLQMYQTLLQSIHRVRHLMWWLFLGLIVKVICSYYLTYYYQLVGTSVSTLLGLCVIVLGLQREWKACFEYQKITIDFYIRLGIQLSLFYGFLWSYKLLWSRYLEETSRGLHLLFALSAVICSGFIYLVLLYWIPLYETKEQDYLPPILKKIPMRNYERKKIDEN